MNKATHPLPILLAIDLINKNPTFEMAQEVRNAMNELKAPDIQSDDVAAALGAIFAPLLSANVAPCATTTPERMINLVWPEIKGKHYDLEVRPTEVSLSGFERREQDGIRRVLHGLKSISSSCGAKEGRLPVGILADVRAQTKLITTREALMSLIGSGLNCSPGRELTMFFATYGAATECKHGIEAVVFAEQRLSSIIAGDIACLAIIGSEKDIPAIVPPPNSPSAENTLTYHLLKVMEADKINGLATRQDSTENDEEVDCATSLSPN